MILPFSKNFPWFSVDGSLIPTDFRNSVQNGVKIHTFRGERWKAGDKIHAYEGNPRNGGTAFGIKLKHAENWQLWIGDFYKKEALLKVWPEELAPTHDVAIPLVDGVEHYKFVFNELGENGTMIQLVIEGKLVVSCNFNLMTRTTHHDIKTSKPMLAQIAQNDGLSEDNFLRWFQYASRKDGVKEIEGNIVHWTPHRYILPMESHDPFTGVYPDQPVNGFMDENGTPQSNDITLPF